MLARIPLSLLSAVADAGYFFGLKRLIASHGQDPVAGRTQLAASALLLAAAFAVGLPAIGLLFLPAVAASTALNAVAMVLALRALRITDLSIAVPILSFTPAVLLLTPPAFGGVLPAPAGVAGVAGVLLIAGGSYVLNLFVRFVRCRTPLEPLRAFGRRDPGVRSMLGVAVIYAFTSQRQGRRHTDRPDPRVRGRNAPPRRILPHPFCVERTRTERRSVCQGRPRRDRRIRRSPRRHGGLDQRGLSLRGRAVCDRAQTDERRLRRVRLHSRGEEGLRQRGAGAATMVLGAAVAVPSSA